MNHKTGNVGRFLDRPPEQVAYVVSDLRDACHTVGRKLGINTWNVWDYDAEYLPQRRYLNHDDAGFRSLVAMAGYGPQLEIIQPLFGPSIFTTFLEARGPGLHHTGYFVESLDAARDWFESRDVAEVQSGGGHGVDGDGRFAFFDLSQETGSYVELIEPPAQRHPPHFVITVT